MDPFIGGSLISAGGSLLGGILGKSKPPGLKYVQNAARASTRGGLSGAIQTARKHGIHALSALGSAQGYSVPYGGTDNSALGAGIADAAATAGQAMASRGLRKKEEELLDAQIAESRSRTLLNVENSRRPLYGPVPSISGITGGLRGSDPGSTSGRGLRVEPTPHLGARQVVALGDVEATGPNPEAFEVGLSELLAGALIYGPQWLGKFLAKGASEAKQKGPKVYRGNQTEYGR